MPPRFIDHAADVAYASQQDECETLIFDFEERQYQTVHAGCEIPKANNFRERTQSGRFIRNKRRNSQTQGRPSIIGWLMDKMQFLFDTRKVGVLAHLVKL